MQEDDILPSQVLPEVYLGTARHAANRGVLHERAPFLKPEAGPAPIRSIVNVSGDVSNCFEQAAAASDSDEGADEDLAALRFEYHRCRLRSGAVVRDVLVAAALFIHAALQRGRPVLIHGPQGGDACTEQAGIADAAAALAAYLVHCLRWPVDACVRALQRQQPGTALPETDLQYLEKLGYAESAPGEPPSDSQILEMLSPPPAVEVVPNFLWLGGADASTAAALKHYAFDAVINATESLPFAEALHVKKLRVPLPPRDNQDAFFEQWAVALEFVDAAQAQGHKVLVHCCDGRSRAAAIVVAHVMRAQGLSFPAALKEVRRRCPSARPSAELASVLQTLESAGRLLPGAAAAAGGAAAAEPRALEDGEAASKLGEAELEVAARQLCELLPVPSDLARESLQRHSGSIERAASELLAWMEGDAEPSARRPAAGAAASSSSSSAPSGGGALQAWAGLAASAVAWEGEAAGAGEKRKAADDSGVTPERLSVASGSAKVRSASEDGTAASEAREREPSAMRLAQCYVGGQEQVPECVICGRSSRRGGAPAVAHPDLGWVHKVCLDQASWS